MAREAAAIAALPGVRRASELGDREPDDGRVLPVRPELAGVLPLGGLRKGSTVVVRDSTSLLLGLLAEATASGAWAAVVGMPDLGLAAAAELGVEVSRLALVPRPGAESASVLSALLDGVELVVAGHAVNRAGGGLAPPVRRRLSARARYRGAVLLATGEWPGAEVELRCVPGEWTGLFPRYPGHGHLRDREVEVRVAGRGAAARQARVSLLLPAWSGGVRPAVPAPGERPRAVASVGAAS